MAADAVDRHDPRMLQPAGDLGLQQEPQPAKLVLGNVGLKHFQCNLAIQFGIESDINLSHPSCRKQADDPIPFTNRDGAIGHLATSISDRNSDMVNGGGELIRIDRAE